MSAPTLRFTAYHHVLSGVGVTYGTKTFRNLPTNPLSVESEMVDIGSRKLFDDAGMLTAIEVRQVGNPQPVLIEQELYQENRSTFSASSAVVLRRTNSLSNGPSPSALAGR